MPNTVTNEKIISATYVALFQRSPDQAGFKYWSDKAAELQLAGKTGNDLAKEMANLFALHPAFTSLYGSLGDAAYIDAIYTNIGGKVADANGRAFWLGKLTDATNPLSRAELVGEFVYTILSITPAELQAQKDAGSITAQELTDALARQDRLNNKSDVALKFTQAMGVGSNLSPGTDPNSLESLQQDPVYLASKAIINGVTEDDATMTAPNTYLNGTPTIKGINETFGDGANDGKTLMLTKGLDNFTPTSSGISQTTSGDDLIIGSIDSANGELNTLSSLDVVNGGAGIDTLKIATADSNKTVTLPNLSNVEIIELQGSGTGAKTTIDTSTTTGVTDVKVTKIAENVKAVAAATTNVDVSMQAIGKTVEVDGAKNVTVKLADVAGNADAVTVGAGGAAKGDVVVEMTGKAATADTTLSAVTVTGGKTVSVTQKAVGDATAVATDTTGFTVTQGAVTVNGNADTTTVTVKQDAAVAKVAAVAAVAAKAATQEVTFTEAKKGDTVKLDFGTGELTFTAKKDLTAAEVASAFANLATGALQGNASATLGIYTDATGGVTNKWSSGAVQTVDATKSKVVFSTSDLDAGTGAQAVKAASVITTAVTGTVTATAATATTGVNAITAKTGVLGVDVGVVDIEDSGAGVIKTITVDGYATGSDIGSDTQATTVLETLNLSNAAGTASMTVADTAATLALTVEKLGAAAILDAKTGAVATAAVEAVLDFTAAPTTLNVKSVGNNRIDLDAAATETLNVSGTGTLVIDERGNNELNGLKTIKVTETAGLTLTRAGTHTDNVTSVDTKGTTGTVTVAIKGAAATYAGGAGVDNVKVYDAGTAIAKAIDLGAGNDRLDLSVDLSGAAIDALTPTVELKGGEGTDTIALSAAAAATLSGGTSFQDKISGFERLEVGTMAASKTVNLENLDAINYVISKGGNAAGTKAVYDLDLTGLVLNFDGINGGDTFSIGGNLIYTATVDGQGATQALAALPATLTIAGVVYDVTKPGANAVKLTAQTAANVTANVSMTVADVSGDAAATAPTTATKAPTTGGVAPNVLTLDKMLTNATVQLDAASDVTVVLKDATGLTDVVNLITNAADGTDIGVATVAGVETINITANDTINGTDVSTNTLALAANKATTVKIDGAGNLKLTLGAASTELTLIDGSTAEGKLEIATLAGDTAATTVKGGSAADTLTAAGANDVLQGGAGKDTLKVTTGSAVTLSGGDGIDAFDLSGYKGTVGGAATITDFAKGETLKFVSDAAADFNSAKVTLISEATFTEYVNEAMKVASANSTVTHGVAWFQFTQGGVTNTFVVQNMAADNTFNDGTDIIVKISGAVDLSASSFNEVGQGTLLYI